MNRIMWIAAALAAGAALATGGYWAGTRHTAQPATAPVSKTERKVLYWHDPMVPGTRFDKPGKSPFMDMQLVPVYADEAQAAGVAIDPRQRQNLGIRYATVRRAAVADALKLVGTTQFDERLAAVVQSRVTGYVERLEADAPLQRVRRGAPVATLFVPDWLAPQEEYLALRRAGDDALAAAARERMRALSIPDALVEQAVRTGKPQSRLVLTAPASGVVTELAVRAGAQVAPGMTLAKIAGTGKLWLLAEVPEALLGTVRPGMAVTATAGTATAGDPARRYTGKVAEILPGVSTATRTAQARLELDNADGTLVPGQLMRVQVGAAAPAARLVVPAEAVIDSGKRSVVLVVGDGDRISPVAVTTGRQFGDDIEIVAGLSEGQKVVASGQFLIDSEANLKSALNRLGPTAPPALEGTGVVEDVSAEALMLSHGPIAALQWPAMTMEFAKPAPGAFADVKPGQRVTFTFHQEKSGYVLDSVTPVAGAAK
ncbi:Cu(I)/Ag(I) efflux system membrane fusion protein [Pseudoduganella flava]|uniref:Cu(I)/Ag(I) efflux system membrane fusion protein n=1 Tax=Pseudoduganella flava TaxID=871742 RepID=A0A562PKL9_9BURK|nr:efflux RND transporter periplasmic adaptor subunit [Pseudoduganella flava]QGZ42365.1 efflux RND transporter periplasmic adaptor subunit [Pseudoduganella flava]TWI44928.1 Cu(I)/Ag(I) efflux system membrane fusion protein [Pseudoduganella flava]